MGCSHGLSTSFLELFTVFHLRQWLCNPSFHSLVALQPIVPSPILHSNGKVLISSAGNMVKTVIYLYLHGF